MLTTIILSLAFIPIVLFIVFYAKGSPWRATLAGRTLMVQKVVTAVLIAYFFVAPMLPDPWHDVVKNIILAALMVVFWLMFATLRLAQTEQRPVSKKHGQGFVPSEDIETTQRTRKHR